MDLQSQLWLGGILLGLIFALIGVIFKLTWAQIDRNSKNIHDLRGQIQNIEFILSRDIEKLREELLRREK